MKISTSFIKRLICTLVMVGFGYLPIIALAAEDAAEDAVNKAMRKYVEQVDNKANALTTEEAVEQAAEKVAEKAVQKATERATEDVVEKAVEKAAEKAVEKATEKAATQVTEKAVEKAVEKAAVKVAEQAAVKSEQIAKRPDEWRGATKVHYFVYVLDIDEIDGAKQNFTANVYLRLRWNDPRQASPEGASRQVALKEVWNPRVLLANRQGLVSKSLPDVVNVHPDGTVNYYQRYTGKLSQILDLSAFPLDTHSFAIHFVSAGYYPDEIDFVPDLNSGFVGGAMADKLSLPDWKILKSDALALPYKVMGEARAPGFAFRFEAKRYFIYYFWQVVLPLTVVVVMSWSGFWIGREHVGVRIGVATSSILTLVAHRFVLANLLPRLPYMTHMDYFTVGCTLLVFLALILIVATSYFATDSRYDRYARKLDVVVRVFFPVVFLSLLFWFVSS